MAQELPVAMTVAEFTKIFSVSRSKTYELIKAQALDARKCGRRTLILGDSASKWLAALPRVEEVAE